MPASSRPLWWWANGSSLLDLKPEYIGTRVVSRYVEVELALRYFAGIDVGGEDTFAVAVRSGQHLAERSDDRAAAADQPGAILTGGQHEAPPFERDVAHTDRKALAIVHRRCAVKANSFGIHRRAQERHVVLP